VTNSVCSWIMECAGVTARPDSGPVARATSRVLVSALQAYRLLLRAHVGNRCRFEPTCSMYAIEAIERHGPAAGSLLSAGRLLRCHPWCEAGFDPVPAHRPSLFGARTGQAARSTCPPVSARSQKIQP
jgi:putative membrane protein insertion efficiency factor